MDLAIFRNLNLLRKNKIRQKFYLKTTKKAKRSQRRQKNKREKRDLVHSCLFRRRDRLNRCLKKQNLPRKRAHQDQIGKLIEPMTGRCPLDNRTRLCPETTCKKGNLKNSETFGNKTISSNLVGLRIDPTILGTPMISFNLADHRLCPTIIRIQTTFLPLTEDLKTTIPCFPQEMRDPVSFPKALAHLTTRICIQFFLTTPTGHHPKSKN